MQERIKIIRKTLKLSQGDFGKKLGVTGNFIWMLEKGEREINNKFIFLLCSLLNVNEDWFRTGEGEMFNELSREDEVADITATLMKDDEPMKVHFIKTISQLREEQLVQLHELLCKLVIEDE